MSRFGNFLMILLSALLVAVSCTRDIVPEPEKCTDRITWSDGVNDLLRKKCNTSGCHAGSSGVGNSRSIKHMEKVNNNGLFKQEVFVRKTMPKDGELTPQELELLKCWADNGFLEN